MEKHQEEVIPKQNKTEKEIIPQEITRLNKSMGIAINGHT